MTYPALLPPDGIDRLRHALTSANYTSAGIADRLGPTATAAVRRNDFRAALKATAADPTLASAPIEPPAEAARSDRDPLATLIRLFICGQVEPEKAVAAALPIEDAQTAGLVERVPGGFKAALDLEPYGDSWWIIADLPAASRPGPLPGDHVLGVGGASSTLANATIRDPVATALDLGTGCGVQALHLSTHARRVTVTDVSPRALRFAATASQLAGLDWEYAEGDLAEPVRGRTFDLVVSNPPFVAGPGTATHAYRDSGRPGDAICAELAAAAPALLNPGGTIQFLANWLHIAGEDWADRVAGWFAGTGMDVWAIEREVSDPMSYVDLWLTDAAEDPDPQRVAAWLDWFDAHKVDAIGFGLITARNTGNQDPVVRVETLRQPLAKPFGPQVKAWFQRQDWLGTQSTEALLATRYRAAPGLTLHQEATIGAQGWDVTRQSLVQTQGLGWSEEIDPVILALIGGCDGSVPLRDQIAVLAAAYQAPEVAFADVAALLVPGLVEHGFIEPVTPETRDRDA